jgi:hypothetical protein
MPCVEKGSVYWVSVGNVEKMGHFEDLGINGQIILKQI